MLLAPQHFQQSSWRHEMLVQYNALLLAPFCWGVRSISIDTKLLPTGIFRVLELEAVMPDGAIVSHAVQDRNELMLDLTPYGEDMKQRDVAVYVSFPVRSSGAMKGALARYEAFEGDPVTDENTGEGELRMPLLKPRLSLMAGDAPPPKYVSFPIAKVRFVDEAFGLTDYIPPTMSVPLRSPLGEMCSSLATRLREKAMFVSEQVRAPSATLDMPLMLENRGRMQGLVAALPSFEALLSTNVAHPFPLYLAMCNLAGQLASLGTSLLPPVLSPYNHLELRASFQEVLNFALRMTNEGIPETYQAFPFRLRDGVFSLLFDGTWMDRRLVLGMRMATGVNEKEMITWGDEALIAAEALIPALRDKRVRGAIRQFVEKDQELVPVRGVILFTLRADSEFIRVGELLQILNFGERGRQSAPLEIVLYVKLGG